MNQALGVSNMLALVDQPASAPVGRFEHEFAELWGFAPLRWSSPVARFLERFTDEHVFDAERFWRHVSQWEAAQRRKEIAASGVRDYRLVA